MIDVGIDHGGDMQVLRSYLQDVCGMSSGVWTYTRVGQPDAHDHQQSVGIRCGSHSLVLYISH